ncbi:MAG: hypothetical protein IKS31_09625 [Clostridia bacterium]|nr:hypothetical protein [Clostridia bacterium]
MHRALVTIRREGLSYKKGEAALNWQKAHPAILAAAAAYLLYLAYGLFDSADDPNTSMAPAIRILFIVLFALAAVGLLVYAFLEWRRRQSSDGEDSDSKDSLK